jgi:hypothetical protein
VKHDDRTACLEHVRRTWRRPCTRRGATSLGPAPVPRC